MSTQRRASFPRGLTAAGALLLVISAPGAAQVARAQNAPAETLVPARFNQLADSRGHRWDVQQNGAVGDGTNDCFDNGLVMRVQGSDVPFSRPMMTADGAEYVLTARRGPLAITRRIRLDAGNAALRYLEIFENTSAAPQQLPVTIHTNLGSNAAQISDTKGRHFSGQLGKDEGAFVAMQPAGNRPGVIFLVADPRAKSKPAIQIQGNRAIEVTYTLDLPVNRPVAIAHYVAQRQGATAEDARALLAAIFKRGRLTDRSLPRQYLGMLANFSAARSGSDADREPSPLLAPFHELVEAADLTRDKLDSVMLNPGSKLAGTVSGGDFSMETAFGKTVVAFSEIAGIAGGAGVGKPLRVFLRSGESLSGSADGAKLAMKTDRGLSFDLDLAQIGLLVMRRTEADGAAPAGAGALLATHQGDRLALRKDDTARIDAATPWGPVTLPLAEVEKLTYGREPFPAYRLELSDGSKLPVMLRGKWRVDTLRFGAMELVPQNVREIQRIAAAEPAPAGAGEQESEGEEAEDELAGPSCMLVGDTQLAGVIDLPEIHLASETSVTPVASAQIVGITTAAADESADATKAATTTATASAASKFSVTVTLAGGGELQGHLTESVLPIRSGARTWRVPVVHLVSLHAPPPKPASSDQPDPSAADSSAEGAAASPSPSPSPTITPGRGATQEPAP